MCPKENNEDNMSCNKRVPSATYFILCLIGGNFLSK